ncbi:DUF692 domain-containing protein [Niveibacterium sp. 24ML]|uniref:MNIO family bufferin maturase n=1 Tax=Niveibacterium sp. 24ML TaxID=2985512 RepID=UPI00226D916B|nr:DUF692 domain-containing protein [Niveibacterium sp. 24ML]MCX9156846.1 DUF692 domain-containing protein [Niveibacterium sp. 24ML]
MLHAPEAAPRPGRGLRAGAGLPLKPQYFAAARARPGAAAFYEVHAENYLGTGGPNQRMLEWVRDNHGLSIHGVGLSIGGEAPLDPTHLERIAALLERHPPDEFSEHLAWSSHGGQFLNDLLPLPYDAASLQRVCQHIDQVQTRLRRRILLENPATYVEFAQSTYSEVDFIGEIVKRTGCGLLLDVSNAHVSCSNHGRNTQAYLQALPLAAVRQIHLAGFATEHDSAGAPLLIDTHDRRVAAEVWALYRGLIAQLGPLPTLIEWDADLPGFDALCDEADKVRACLEQYSGQIGQAA